MPDGMQDHAQLCSGIQMTPVQCNEIIETSLSNLMPVVQSALASLLRVNALLEDGGVDWRKSLRQAIDRAKEV